MTAAVVAKLTEARGAKVVPASERELEYQRSLITDMLRHIHTIEAMIDAGKPLPRDLYGHCRTWHALMGVLL